MPPLNRNEGCSTRERAGQVSVEWRTSPDVFASRIRRFASVSEAIAFMSSSKEAFLGEFRCALSDGSIIWTTRSACREGDRAGERIPQVIDVLWRTKYTGAMRRSRYGVLARKIMRRAVDEQLITHADGRAITNAIRKAFDEPTVH